MKKPITIVAYSDIHLHQYTNGLLLSDVASVDHQISEIARNNKADLIVFGGDWSLDKNPGSSVLGLRDFGLAEKAEIAKVAVLVGNHDRESKSMHSAHTLSYLPAWKNDNVVVMDKVGPYHITDNISIYAIPAGHQISGVQSSHTDYNICMFHDMVRGSRQQNGMIVESGISITDLDVPGFDVVLGGDNHVHQALVTKNVPAYYIGAPMQHNYGDEGDERGCMLIHLSERGLEAQHIKLRYPKFIRIHMSVDSADTFDNIIKFVQRYDVTDNIVTLLLTGTHSILTTTRKLLEIEDILKATLKPRTIKIVSEPTIAADTKIPEMKNSETPENDWNLYTKHAVTDTNGLDIQEVYNTGLKAIQHVIHNRKA